MASGSARLVKTVFRATSSKNLSPAAIAPSSVFSSKSCTQRRFVRRQTRLQIEIPILVHQMSLHGAMRSLTLW